MPAHDHSPMSTSERNFARRIDLTSLQLFVAVCELGSIGRAAEREFIAASAISKRLSDLEATLGTTLLYRHARGVDLTPAGESLLHHARSVLYSLEKMQGELSEYADGVRGHVRVHANISAIVQFLPEDLGVFTRAHEAIKIDLEEHLSSEVIRAVQEGAADLGVCHVAGGAGELQSLSYRHDRLALIVPAGHVLAAQGVIDFIDSLDFDHVGLHTNSSIYVAMHEAALNAGRSVKLRIHVTGLDAHVPDDRKRPGHRRDAAARLRAHAQRHRPRPGERGAERHLGRARDPPGGARLLDAAGGGALAGEPPARRAADGTEQLAA
jgi:DNA-binding transcriptional LysR family regulator